MAIGPKSEQIDMADLDVVVRGVYDAAGKKLTSASGVSTVGALPTITATTGSLPTADGATTVADAATPTVAELLELIVELRVTVTNLRTAVNAIIAA